MKHTDLESNGIILDYRLTVFGTRLTPIDPVATMGSSRNEDVQQQLADMEEEIFESEGVIEEYFAYDRLKSW